MKLKKGKSSIPILFDGNVEVSDVSQKAHLLNTRLVKNFNYSLAPLSHPCVSDNLGPLPDDLVCSEDDILNMLSKLLTSKATGPDGISGRMLRETCYPLVSSITRLFNLSLEIPAEWKVAQVCPIPKSSESSNPDNYRPISLLCIVSKLLERHVRDCLIDFLERKAVLSPNQWGLLRAGQQLVLWSSSLTVGIDHLSRGMMFVLFFWISVKPSTKFPPTTVKQVT